MSGEYSRGRANLLIGVALVGLGALFLLGQVFHVNMWAFFWPFFILIPGLLFFVGMALGGKAAGPLAIPGSVVTMVGLILMYQSVTHHWTSWVYAWALIFPTSVGIGLVINGAWSEVDRLVTTGMKWIVTGVTIFLIGGVFFELILNISGGALAKIVWPGLLIVLGIYLLTRRRDEGHHEPPATFELPTRPVVHEAEEPRQPAVEFEPLDQTRAGKKG
jgi:hypothetical protein